jgi:hypothetical protein
MTRSNVLVVLLILVLCTYIAACQRSDEPNSAGIARSNDVADGIAPVRGDRREMTFDDLTTDDVAKRMHVTLFKSVILEQVYTMSPSTFFPGKARPPTFRGFLKALHDNHIILVADESDLQKPLNQLASHTSAQIQESWIKTIEMFEPR